MSRHRYLLRIDKGVWDRFVSTLPESISVNKKIERLIIDYLIEYESALKKMKTRRLKT